MNTIDLTFYQKKADEIWSAMTASERVATRFQLLPEIAMDEAIRAGFDQKALASCIFEIARSKGTIVS